MKKLILTSCLAAATLIASAEAYERPSFCEGWTVGLTTSAITPLKGHSFFENMRPTMGIVLDKKVSPAFSVGAEGIFSFNTSRWNVRGVDAAGDLTWHRLTHSEAAIDHSYVGAYAALDFMGLSSKLENRVFSMGLQAGAGWGHSYFTSRYQGETKIKPIHDHNFFATKAGLFFNFNVCENFTISLEPSVIFDMSDAVSYKADKASTSASYNANYAAFQLQAGFKYHFGKSFQAVTAYDGALIADLNDQINALRAEVAAAVAATAVEAERAALLAAQLEDCLNSKPEKEVIKEVKVDNRLNTELDVFFNIGSSKITEAQMPNVERIADYLKTHPTYIVIVKGYASKDGNRDLNIKLAKARAESVRNALINKYGINANRIQAEGCGIGEMFEVESWNRVSICTLEQK